MLIVRAIDTGYGLTKYTTSGGAYATCAHFPSIAVEKQGGVGEGILERLDTLTLEIEGIAYEVGPDAYLARGAQSSRILHDDYCASPEYLALTRAALAYMQVERIDLLVVGLPVSLLERRKALLKQRLQGQHPLPNGRAVEVAQVLVVAQPVGGLIHYLFNVANGNERQDKTRLLIDPGSRTFDWTVTRGMKESKGLSGSHNGSIAAFLTEIARLLSEHYGIDYHDLFALDEGVRGGPFHLYGQPVDLQPFIAKAAPKLQPALTALVNAVGDGRQIDEIVLVGGGAFVFQNAIAKQFPKHRVITIPESLYGNVRGFQKAGEVKALNLEAA